jgi:hypothetical protein
MKKDFVCQEDFDCKMWSVLPLIVCLTSVMLICSTAWPCPRRSWNSSGCELLVIEEFEEGDPPRKLFRVALRKTDIICNGVPGLYTVRDSARCYLTILDYPEVIHKQFRVNFLHLPTDIGEIHPFDQTQGGFVVTQDDGAEK